MSQPIAAGGNAPPRRWWRRRRVGLIALCLLLTAGYWIGTTRLDGWLQALLEDQVRVRLGGQLNFESFEVQPARLRISFSGARLQLPAHPSGAIDLRVQSATLQVHAADLLALAAGKISFSSMELERPTVELVMTENDGGLESSAVSAPRPLEIRIGRLSVVDGSFICLDRSVPWGIDARQVKLDAAWNRLRSTLEGGVAFNVSIARPPLQRPLSFHLDSRFRLDRHGIEVRHANIHGDGLEGHFEGSVDLGSAMALTGRGNASVALEKVRDVLPGSIRQLSGDVTSTFTVEASPRGSILLGTVEASDGRFEEWSFDRISSRARLSAGQLELSEIVGEALGGSFDGSGSLRWDEGQSFDLRLNSDGLQLSRLLDALTLGRYPLSAEIRGAAQLGGDPLEPGSWNGSGRFQLQQTAFDVAEISLSGPAELVVRDGRVRIDGEIVLSASHASTTIELDMAGRSGPTLQVEGSTRNFRDTQLALMHIASSAGEPLPSIARERLDGSGIFAARLTTGASTALQLSLSVDDGHFGRQRFERMELELQLRDEKLKIDRLEMTDGEQHLMGQAALTLEPFVVEQAIVSARGVSVAWIATTAELQLPADGTVDAELSFSDGQGRGELTVRTGRIFDEPFNTAEASLSFTSDRIGVEHWSVESENARLEGDASLVPQTGYWSLNVDSGQGDIAGLSIVKVEQIPVEGDFEFSASLSQDADGLQGRGVWKLSRARVVGVPLDTVDGVTSVTDGRITTDMTGSGGSWSAETSMTAQQLSTIEASIELDDWVYELDPEDPDAGWVLLGAAFRIGGRFGSLDEIEVDGSVQKLELTRGNQSVSVAEPFDLHYGSGRIALSQLQLVGAGTRAELDLTYDLTGDRLEATARGQFDLGLLVAGWPEFRATGPVEGQLQLDGPITRPRITGGLRGHSGRMQWLGLAQRIEELSWKAEFEGSRIEVSDLRARMGNGALLGQGAAELTPEGIGQFAFQLEGANVRLEYPEGFRGIYEGSLSFAGTPAEASVDGEVRLLRGIYGKEFAFGGGVTAVQAAPDTTLPDWINLDIAIRAEDEVWVRNKLAQLQAALDLHLGGSLRRPQLTGRAALLEGGELRFRDVEYDVVSGSLELLELERIDPYLTLRAQTTVADYTVYLRVEGTFDSFEFDLTSEPSLTTPDIIALLTTGRTLEEVSGQGSDSPSGDMAANYFGGALTGVFERQLERLLGLKRVRIDPILAAGQSDPTTRLTLGEEFTENIFVVFSTDLNDSENQFYSVTWKATPRVRVGVERDTQGGVGGNVRYTARFWLRKPQTISNEVHDATRIAASEQRLPVRSITIDGVDGKAGDELRRQLPFKSGDRISRTSVFRGVESLKRWFIRQNLLEARVEAELKSTTDGVDVVYRADPGPVVMLEFDGISRRQKKSLLEQLEQRWIDAVFIDELYEETRQAILDHFREQGHYAVDVSLERSDASDQRLLTYRVDLGRPVRIREIEIAGMQQLDPAKVRGLLELRPTSMLSRRVLTPSSVQRDAERIRAFYRNEGFLDVQMDDPKVSLTLDGGAADVRFELTEGERYRVESITFDRLGSFPEETLADWARIRVGDVFSGPEVLQAESRLRAGIDAAGFPDARVSGLAQLRGVSVALEFKIDPGESQTIAEVEISGNGLTQDKIIRRALKMDVGDLASRDSFLQSQHALYRLGIFRNVRLALEPMERGVRGDRRLRVEVDEAAPMSSTVGVGWDSEARARLGLSLTHDNVGGYDRVLSMQGRISSLEERLQLIGEEPRFLNRDLKGLLSVGYSRDEEEGFVVARATSAIRLEKELSPNWRALARYSFQQVNLADVTLSPSELQIEKLVDGRLGDIGLTLVRDMRDNPFSPSRGSYLTFGARVFSRPMGSEFDFVKTSGNLSLLFGVTPRTAFATGLRAGVAIPYGSNGAVPISEAFFAGGDTTVRGFKRDAVGPAGGGEAMLVFNQEYRFPIWSNLRGVLFFDAGNVWITRSEIDSGLRRVLGTGLRYETPVGPLRLEYGRKLDREAGESSGEFFLAIGNAF